MKVMAIDYGDARTGIAVSDPTGSIVGTALVIPSYDREKTARQIAELAERHGVEIRDFAALLREAAGLEPVLWDERRTTVDAHRILSENNRRGKKRKQTVDAVAASLILEGYLAFLRR